MAAVGRRVGGVHPGSHHRGLMTHQVDTGQQRRQRPAVSEVDLVASRRQLRIGSVRGGQQQVDTDHLVPAARSAAPTREPMKPAAPVSNTLMAVQVRGDDL